jgi:hypothetical protein
MTADRSDLSDRLNDVEDAVRATDTICVLIERRAVDANGVPLPESEQPEPTVVEM